MVGRLQETNKNDHPLQLHIRIYPNILLVLGTFTKLRAIHQAISTGVIKLPYFTGDETSTLFLVWNIFERFSRYNSA